MAGKSLFRDDVPEVVIKSIFRKYDLDNSGCLEKTEILAMLRDMGFEAVMRGGSLCGVERRVRGAQSLTAPW